MKNKRTKYWVNWGELKNYEIAIIVIFLLVLILFVVSMAHIILNIEKITDKNPAVSWNDQSTQNIQVRALPEHFTRPLGLSRGTAEAREIDDLYEWEDGTTVVKNSDVLNALDWTFGTEEGRLSVKRRDNGSEFFEIEPRLAFISEKEFAEIYNEGALLKRVFYLVGDENKPQISYLTDYFEAKFRLSKIGNEQSDYVKLIVKTGLPPMESHRRSDPYMGELYFLFDASEIRLHTPHGLFEVIKNPYSPGQ